MTQKFPLALTDSETEAAREIGILTNWPSHDELMNAIAHIDGMLEPERPVQSLYAKLRWTARIGPRNYGFGSEPEDGGDPFVTARFRAGRERGSVRAEDNILRLHQYLLAHVAVNAWELPTKKLIKETIGLNVPSGPIPLWVYLVPPCPYGLVPAPDDTTAAAAALLYSGTVHTVDKFAEQSDGPARWAKNWAIDFYMSCLYEPLGADLDQYDRRSNRAMVTIMWDNAVSRLQSPV